MKTILGFIVCVAAATMVAAQGSKPAPRRTTIGSAADYSLVMKEINSIVLADFTVPPSSPPSLVGDPADIDAEPDPLEASRRLWVLLRDVQAYWEGRNVAAAAKFAKDATSAVEDLAKSLGSDDAVASAAAKKAITTQCQNCHAMFREDTPNGGFRIRAR